jgi:hypothetical protein
VSAYHSVCVLILLYQDCAFAGDDSAMCVSAYHYIIVLMLLSIYIAAAICVRIPLYNCRHAAKRCWSLLTTALYVCPHTTIYVSSFCYVKIVRVLLTTALCVSAYHYICVLILLYKDCALAADDSAMCVSAYHYIIVLILLSMQD